MNTQAPPSPRRRSFMSHFQGGAAALAAIVAGSAAVAGAQTSPPRFEPARHDKDDWLDKIPGQHRLIFDTTTPDGLGDAIAFAANYIRSNRTDYGLQPADLAVVIVMRHRSTPFGYVDAAWAKYAAPMAARIRFKDPKTDEPAKHNMYNSTDYGDLLPNRGVNLDSLFKQGVQLAVCSSATRAMAGVIATATGGNIDTINAELIASLVPNSRMVPAGIITVNRAQERGYSLVKA